MTTKHLLYNKFIIQFAGKRIFKIGEHLAKLRTKRLIVSRASFALRFFSWKTQKSPDK